jgi:hypothetical protein
LAAETARPFTVLGDLNPTHGLRPIPIGQQVESDARPVLDEEPLQVQVRDRHLVDAGRTLVPDHAGIGRRHVIAADNKLHQPHVHLR